MDFRSSPEEETFAQEVRPFLAREVTPEVQAEGESGWHAEGLGLGHVSEAFLIE